MLREENRIRDALEGIVDGVGQFIRPRIAPALYVEAPRDCERPVGFNRRRHEVGKHLEDFVITPVKFIARTVGDQPYGARDCAAAPWDQNAIEDRIGDDAQKIVIWIL